MNVDPTAAVTLSDSQFPVTVDPQFQIIPATMGTGWHSYNQAGTQITNSDRDGVSGYSHTFGANDHWRFVIDLGYGYLWTHVAPNARVFSANMQFDIGTPARRGGAVHPGVQFPDRFEHAVAAGDGVSRQRVELGSVHTVNPGTCSDYSSYGYTRTPSVLSGYPGTALVDITNVLRPYVASHNDAVRFGASLTDRPTPPTTSNQPCRPCRSCGTRRRAPPPWSARRTGRRSRRRRPPCRWEPSLTPMPARRRPTRPCCTPASRTTWRTPIRPRTARQIVRSGRAVTAPRIGGTSRQGFCRTG